MVEITDTSLAEIAEQERTLQFDSFTYADAWNLGSRLVHLAVQKSHAVAICIFLGEQRVFQAGLSGSSADNDSWLERKVRTVRRYNISTLALAKRLRSYGIDALDGRMGADPAFFVASGGAFPLRVRGSLVGVVAVSGLDDASDHALAVEALEGLLEEGGFLAIGRNELPQPAPINLK